VTFTTENAVLLLEALTRPATETPDPERKSIIGELAQVIISDLLKLPSAKWADAVDVVRDLGHERHIQVLSFDPEEQTIIRDFRWDGRIEGPASDYVMFNEASLLSTKLNLLIQPEGEYTIDVHELGDAVHELRLRYHNPLPEWAADKDPQLVRDLMLGGVYGGYLRIFGPPGIADATVEVDGAPAGIEDTGREGPTEWFGTLLPLGAGESREVVFRWRSTPGGVIERDGYRLYLQKQPGTRGLCLALTVVRGGEPAKDVRIEGGTRDAEGRVCLTSDVRITARFD
jgi:hypothetical protein